jgi:DNA replication and repair protein RecF
LETASLQTLELENFRNIVSLELSFHPAFNFFFGENAQGKTALLESLFLLSELKSFRTQDLTALIQHQKEYSNIIAKVRSEDLDHDLKIQLTLGQKEVTLNGKTPRPYRRLRRLIPVVLFTPESVRLFRSSPGDRRHYFDHYFSLLSEGYAKDIEEYARLLKQKKELLEQIREGGDSHRRQKEIWDERLAELGAKVAWERLQRTAILDPSFQRHFRNLSGGEWEAKLQYVPYQEKVASCEGPEPIHQLYREEIRRREGEEIERSQVLVGPHRDDWEILLGKERLKEEGSQGQHRISVAALLVKVTARMWAGSAPCVMR